MHVEAGHSAVPEEGPKDLRCPLCLYHTKYKHNMIDHIVLHRGNLQTDSLFWGPGGREVRSAAAAAGSWLVPQHFEAVPWVPQQDCSLP